MPTPKLAEDRLAFRRRILRFANARSAFETWLRACGLAAGDVVLLPGYVGWSAREGSGVFDPLTRLELRVRFYRFDDRLNLDLASAAEALADGRVRVLVLIHLFGHVDPACAELVALARRQGVRVLEDEAHAMLTDLVGGASGRLGEACVFSLHKLLPVPTGGCLVFNSFRDPILGNIELPAEERELLEFDLAEIARRRRENQETLVRLLDLSDALREKVVPLWGALPYPEVPQTVPVLVPEGLRDRLYHAMNQLGFGVVSLYHTLIEPLATEEFAASRAVSRRILNLPVHQDVEPAELERLVAALGDLVGRA